MNIVGVEDNKVYIKNDTGKVLINPLSVNCVISCLKEVMQVSEFACEVKESK